MKTLPSGASAKARLPWHKTIFWLVVVTSPITGFIVFVIAALNPVYDEYGYGNHTLPWWGVLGIAPLVLIIGFVLFSGWVRMVRNFSHNPLARLLFGLLTLLMAGSGIGFLVDIYLYFYVMAGQPRLLTGEPLGPGPQRERWLAERRPVQTVNIDARQVHIHG